MQRQDRDFGWGFRAAGGPSGRLLLVICVMQFGAAACAMLAPEPEPVVAGPPQRTHYTLHAGESVPDFAPLPTRTDIFVDWHYDNGSTETLTGFRAWDFSGNGRFDMVEVLDEDGHPISYIYDFDGDGEPDVTRAATMSAAPSAGETESAAPTE